MDRRRFLQSIAIAAASPALSTPCRADDPKVGPLRPDRHRLLDLPDGYSYSVVSKAGKAMSDGLVVPHAHDGMAAFSGEDGRIILVCNHELRPAYFKHSAFAGSRRAFERTDKDKIYDQGGGLTPGAGRTLALTSHYNNRIQPTDTRDRAAISESRGYRIQLCGRTDTVGELVKL
jgi:secreted PhoX family phosphatase